MNLYFRLMVSLLRGFFQPPMDYALESERWFRVWPQDVDVFGHMNNGRYLQIIDLARTHWMTRVGVIDAMLKHRWTALLGSGFTRYRHSLKPFQRYCVRTRIAYWDHRWFYFEYRFYDVNNRCIAMGVSRAAVRSKGRWVPTEEATANVQSHMVSPPEPEYLQHWLSMERTLDNSSSVCKQSYEKGCDKLVLGRAE